MITSSVLLREPRVEPSDDSFPTRLICDAKYMHHFLRAVSYCCKSHIVFLFVLNLSQVFETGFVFGENINRLS